MEITSQGNTDFLIQVSKTQQAKKKKIKTKKIKTKLQNSVQDTSSKVKSF